MALRDAGPQPLTLRRAAVQAGHVGGGVSLVDEGQSGRVEIELALEPCRALLQKVGPVLFGSMGGLF